MKQSCGSYVRQPCGLVPHVVWVTGSSPAWASWTLTRPYVHHVPARLRAWGWGQEESGQGPWETVLGRVPRDPEVP